MRVVHFLEQCNVAVMGGLATFVVDTCAGLARERHDVTLVTCDAKDVPSDWLAGSEGCPRVVVIDAPVTRLRLLGRSARETLRAELEGADLVHLHGMWESSNVQVASMAQSMDRPYVVTAHGMLDDWSMAQSSVKKRLFLRLFGNGLLRRAEAVHCTARGEAEQAQAWTTGTPTRVVPYMMDTEPYRALPSRSAARARFGIQTEAPVVAFISRIHHKKGLEHLIEAAANLKRVGTPVHLLIAGSGDPAYVTTIRAMVERLGLADQCTFTGFVRGEDKILVYRAADIMALPTYQENFGIVLAESLACETPVVTTKGVDIWPELEESGSAILLDTPDWAPLGDAIGQLVEDRERLARMGERGRAFVLNWVSQAVVIRGYERLYFQALERAMARERTIPWAKTVASAG